MKSGYTASVVCGWRRQTTGGGGLPNLYSALSLSVELRHTVLSLPAFLTSPSVIPNIDGMLYRTLLHIYLPTPAMAYTQIPIRTAVVHKYSLCYSKTGSWV